MEIRQTRLVSSHSKFLFFTQSWVLSLKQQVLTALKLSFMQSHISALLGHVQVNFALQSWGPEFKRFPQITLWDGCSQSGPSEISEWSSDPKSFWSLIHREALLGTNTNNTQSLLSKYSSALNNNNILTRLMSMFLFFKVYGSFQVLFLYWFCPKILMCSPRLTSNCSPLCTLSDLSRFFLPNLNPGPTRFPKLWLVCLFSCWTPVSQKGQKFSVS